MMAKGKALTSGPRHKRLNRAGRLLAARHWLEKYQGKNILQGYKKHFGVDWDCAIAELQLLNVKLDEEYVKRVRQSVEEQAKAKVRRKEEQEREEWLAAYSDSDETFCFIAGYTEGGAPFGTPWDEGEEEKKSNLSDRQGFKKHP